MKVAIAGRACRLTTGRTYSPIRSRCAPSKGEWVLTRVCARVKEISSVYSQRGTCPSGYTDIAPFFVHAVLPRQRALCACREAFYSDPGRIPAPACARPGVAFFHPVWTRDPVTLRPNAEQFRISRSGSAPSATLYLLSKHQEFFGHSHIQISHKILYIEKHFLSRYFLPIVLFFLFTPPPPVSRSIFSSLFLRAYVLLSPALRNFPSSCERENVPFTSN